MLNPDHAEPRAFAADVLRRLGARVEPDTGGLRAELTREQLETLEGRPLWTLPAGSLITLHLAFDQAEAGGDERAELLVPGSFRLDQLCRVALERGRMGRAWLAVPGVRARRFRPYLVFHFRLTYVGPDPRERLAAVAVDLVAGEALFLPKSPSRVRFLPRPDGTPADPPRLTLGEAHRQALAVLAARIAREDAGWARAARLRIEREREAIIAFLHTSETSEGEPPPWLKARLRELDEAARPEIRARAEAVTLLYLPLIAGEPSGRLYNPVFRRTVPPDPPAEPG